VCARRAETTFGEIDDLLVYCRKHPDVRGLIRGTVGAMPKHGGAREQVDNINLKTPGGTSPTYALRRLKRDRPDLAERVLPGAVRRDLEQRPLAVPDQDHRRRGVHLDHQIPRLGQRSRCSGTTAAGKRCRTQLAAVNNTATPRSAPGTYDRPAIL